LGDAYKLTGFKPETVMGADAELIAPAKVDVEA
jgi:hypothetical protein